MDIGSSVISSIGQADDTILISDDIYRLSALVTLIEDYCHKYKVELVPSKTKLLCISSKVNQEIVDYFKLMNPIKIDDKSIGFSDKLEHVGIVRSTMGNMVSVSERITAQKRAIGSTISAGLASTPR